MVMNLDVKTACKNVFQPEPNIPLRVRTQPDPLYVPEVNAQLCQPCALGPVAYNQRALFLFLLFPHPQLSPCSPHKATILG